MRFLGQTYVYNTPNDGPRELGVTGKIGGDPRDEKVFVVGWQNDARTVLNHIRSIEPCSDYGVLQGVLDKYAEKHALVEWQDSVAAGGVEGRAEKQRRGAPTSAGESQNGGASAANPGATPGVDLQPPLRLNPDRIVIPPEAACVPELSDVQFRALVESIRERGIEIPLRVCLVNAGSPKSDFRLPPSDIGPRTSDLRPTAPPSDWILLSGRHRLRAALTLGMSTVPCVEAKMPLDLRAAMIEEAIVCRDLPRAGRAALLLDIHPELMERAGERGNPSGTRNLKKGHVLPNCQPLAIRDDKGSEHDATILSLSDRYGLHRDYLSAVIDARLECREGSTDWAELRGHLCLEPMAPARVICCLRGIQSEGKSAETKLPGKSGANYNNLILSAPVSLGAAWEHWADLEPLTRQRSLARWTTAAAHMPAEAIDCLIQASTSWSGTDQRRIWKALKARADAETATDNTRKGLRT